MPFGEFERPPTPLSEEEEKIEKKEIHEVIFSPDQNIQTQHLDLLDILPEGSKVKVKRLPQEERTELFYKKPKEYLLYNPAEIKNKALFQKILEKYRLSPETLVLMLPYGERNKIGFESRKLYFAAVLSPDGKMRKESVIPEEKREPENLPTTRIISFGNCNVACPYCKRDCQFIDEKENPVISLPIPLKEVARLVEGAVLRKEIVRFSGGDPVAYPKQTLALAEYLFSQYGAKVSVAHNGSGPKLIREMLPYLSSAAIDLKAVPEKIPRIMGINPRHGQKMYQRSLECQRLISHERIPLDVRTPIFSDTTMEEMDELAGDIEKVNDLDYTFWTWRIYKPVKGCDWSAPSKENVIEMLKRASSAHPNLWMGIRAKWERGGMLFFKNGEIVNSTTDLRKKEIPEIGSGNLITIS